MLRGELRQIQPGRADRRARGRSIRARPRSRRAAFEAATGDYTRVRVGGRSHRQPAARSRHAARRAPTSTPSASIARSVAGSPWRWPTSARMARNFIGWTDVGGQYRSRRGPLPDGRSVPVFALDTSVTPTSARRFLLTNPDGYSLHVQRPRDGGRKATVQRLAGLRLVYVLEGLLDCSRPAGRPPRARKSARSRLRSR